AHVHAVGQLLDDGGEVAGGGAGALLPGGGRRGCRALLPGLAVAAGGQLLGVHVLAAERVGDVADPFAQRGGVDVVLGVVGELLFPAPVRLVDRLLHSGGDRVGVHVHLTGDIPGSPSDRLDQRGARTQEAFLVRVQDAHQGDFGQVEAFAQQVDPDQDVEGSGA